MRKFIFPDGGEKGKNSLYNKCVAESHKSNGLEEAGILPNRG